MINKNIALTVAAAFCFGCCSQIVDAAVPVVVSNKPLSVSMNSNNSEKYSASSNKVKKTIKTKKKQEQKKSVKNNKDVKKQDKAVINKSVKFYDIELPENYQEIKIFGDSVATKGQAVALIKQYNPDVKLDCSVEELVDLYWTEAEREGVRPDLALAQALVETGYFRYGGDVHHNQNNFCGLGTTGNGVKGAKFKTPEIGVRAHIQHLLAYTQQKRPSTKIVDPRYELAHRIRLERGVVDTWYGLNGTWAMGSQYCEKIMVNYQRMLAMQADDFTEPAKDKEEKSQTDKKNNPHRMRELVERILHEGK